MVSSAHWYMIWNDIYNRCIYFSQSAFGSAVRRHHEPITYETVNHVTGVFLSSFPKCCFSAERL